MFRYHSNMFCGQDVLIKVNELSTWNNQLSWMRKNFVFPTLWAILECSVQAFDRFVRSKLMELFITGNENGRECRFIPLLGFSCVHLY